ncbi:hypothetical protein [Streptomyces auratus]|uniref:Acetyltransferase n=1 Tax=Streptomyces auratus AGR0001 TaxID=1160718 RepID=J1ZM81_9ACTN|nr:hypothetical protein [Streptomyces auratus]QTZ95710.1 hypothetical protein SU9_033175 [Streptomyces auratus AGR0001]
MPTEAAAWQAFRLPGVDFVEVVHDRAHRASSAVPGRLGFTEHLRRPAERLAPAETGEDQIWRLNRRQLEVSSSRPAPHPDATMASPRTEN